MEETRSQKRVVDRSDGMVGHGWPREYTEEKDHTATHTQRATVK